MTSSPTSPVIKQNGFRCHSTYNPSAVYGLSRDVRFTCSSVVIQIFLIEVVWVHGYTAVEHSRIGENARRAWERAWHPSHPIRCRDGQRVRRCVDPIAKKALNFYSTHHNHNHNCCEQSLCAVLPFANFDHLPTSLTSPLCSWWYNNRRRVYSCSDDLYRAKSAARYKIGNKLVNFNYPSRRAGTFEVEVNTQPSGLTKL